MTAFFSASMVFSSGGTETPAPLEKNPEWVLAVTPLNVSSLPASRQIMGDIIYKTLLESLGGITSRIRGQEELDYYRDYAWSQSQTDAAKALAAKRNERGLLLYRGDPRWRYDKNITVVEKDIAALEEKYLSAVREAPGIVREPLVVINSSQQIPPPAGGEYRFCMTEKADAFLCGKVSEFHGRIYVSLALYTLYSRSYSWEDGILFSSEDLNSAVSELESRLRAEVTGTRPSALIVHAEPEDAVIIIDDHFAGRGEVPLSEHDPGDVTVSSYADNHAPVFFPLELHSGEISEMFFNLTPLGLSAFTVDAPGSKGAFVFLGSRFMGQTPLRLDLPVNRFAYITVETPEGKTGTAVYQSGAPVRGSAEFVNTGDTLVFNTAFPVSPEENRVASARDDFYSAYGRLWIGLPVSLIAWGMADNYIRAYNNSVRPTTEMFHKKTVGDYVTYGAWTVMGIVFTETIYRIIRYLIISGANADPVARFDTVIPESSE